jgi:hypothetical protein
MRARALRLAALALLAGTAGCYPYVAVDRPPLSGRLTAADGTPLVGQHLYACTTDEPDWADTTCKLEPLPAHTSSSGTFELKQESHWAVFSPVTKQEPPTLAVVAVCLAHDETVVAVSCVGGDGTVDVDATAQPGPRVIEAEGCGLPPERKAKLQLAAETLCARSQPPVAKKARRHSPPHRAQR